jgi:hypothetical protein
MVKELLIVAKIQLWNFTRRAERCLKRALEMIIDAQAQQVGGQPIAGAGQ